MKCSTDDMSASDGFQRLDREISLRQNLSAARCAKEAAERALASADAAIRAAEHAMKVLEVSEERWSPYDGLEGGEGDPPALLLYLHHNYPTNDGAAKELLTFYSHGIDFAIRTLQTELKEFPLKVALQRHEWALTALRFESTNELEKWAAVDPERFKWLKSYRGYRGFRFGE